MGKRRILYRLGGSGRDQWMFKLATKLQKKVDCEPYFMCTKFGYSYIQQRIDEQNILFLDDKNNQIVSPDLSFLNSMEEKFDFNIWDQWEIVAQRRLRERRTPISKILIRYEYVIREVYEFIIKNKITDYVIYGPSSAEDIIFLKIMKKNNINIIELRTVPLSKRFGISNEFNNELCGLKENYNYIKKNGLTNEDKEESIKVLQSYRKNKQKPDCAVKYKEPKINKLKQFSKKVWKAIKHKQLPSRYRPLFWGIIQKSYDHLGIFEQPVKGEKFVLFPLHFQPEASTLIHGKWYNNQLNLIENLVRSIPIGYKLYVKEHSYGYGNRSLSFYKEIKRYACVRLISPHTNNLDLIKNSSLIVSITGTAGWEAIMFQKPTIVFGDVFYEVFDCVKKIKNIRDLSATIRESLDKEINYKETLTCLASLMKSTYSGLARLPGDCANRSLEDENIKLLAEGIVNHMKKNEIQGI